MFLGWVCLVKRLFPLCFFISGLVDCDFKDYIENLSMIEEKYHVVWNDVGSLFMSFIIDDPNFDGHWHKKIKQHSCYQQAQADIRSNTATDNGNNNSANPTVSTFEATYAANNSVFRRSFSKGFNSIGSCGSNGIFITNGDATSPPNATYSS